MARAFVENLIDHAKAQAAVSWCSLDLQVLGRRHKDIKPTPSQLAEPGHQTLKCMAFAIVATALA